MKMEHVIVFFISYSYKIILQIQTSKFALTFESRYLRNRVTLKPQTLQSGVFVETVNFLVA